MATLALERKFENRRGINRAGAVVPKAVAMTGEEDGLLNNLVLIPSIPAHFRCSTFELPLWKQNWHKKIKQ